MKKNTITQKVPSIREESLNMIIRQFLDSDEQQVKLILYPKEVSMLEKEYQDIVFHYKNVYHPDCELSIFIISKRKKLE